MQWVVLDGIVIGFRQVVHTHSAIDQFFSSTLRRLRSYNAIHLAYMTHELSQCFNDHTEVSLMDCCINWCGLFDASDCMNKVERITSYRFFRFNRCTIKNGVVFHVGVLWILHGLHFQSDQEDLSPTFYLAFKI